jgi:hypothetical protein
MKNKNTDNPDNKNANQLVDLVLELQSMTNNKDFAYPYATGMLISIIEGARCYNDDIQASINRTYEGFQEDLEKLKAKKFDDLQRVINSAKPEELYA